MFRIEERRPGSTGNKNQYVRGGWGLVSLAATDWRTVNRANYHATAKALLDHFLAEHPDRKSWDFRIRNEDVEEMTNV